MGDFLAELAKTDLSKVGEGISVLRETWFKTAGDQLRNLMNDVPVIKDEVLRMPEGSQQRFVQLERFARRAQDCFNNADMAFHSVKTIDQQMV